MRKHFNCTHCQQLFTTHTVYWQENTRGRLQLMVRCTTCEKSRLAPASIDRQQIPIPDVIARRQYLFPVDHR